MGRRTLRWHAIHTPRAALAVGTLWLIVAAGCTSHADQDRTAPPATTVRHTAPVVGVDRLTHTPKIADVFPTASGLLSLNWMWNPDPVSISTNDGRTWNAAALPAPTPTDSANLGMATVDDTVIVFTRADNRLAPSPAIWSSTDGGRTFHTGEGVATSDDFASVNGVVGAKGRLIALGTTHEPAQPMAHHAGAAQATRWVSSDRGRTWTRSSVTGNLGSFLQVVSASNGTIIAIVQPPQTKPGSTQLLMTSLDGGATFQSVRLPGQSSGDSVKTITTVAGVPYVVAGDRTWTMNKSGTWRELGRAPVIGDADGAAPETSTVEAIATAGDVLIGAVHSFFNYDHELEQLAYSTDRGTTWHRAKAPMHYDGRDASSTVRGAVAFAGFAVATWTCNTKGTLFTSADDGRTWKATTPGATAAMGLGRPVRVSNDQVLVFASKNAEQGADAVITISRRR